LGIPGVAFGSEEYRLRVQRMAQLVFRAYEGGAVFRWLNQEVVMEVYDFFLAGILFGAVRRRDFGCDGYWDDMHLAWIDDLRRVCDPDPMAVELDGGVVVPEKYVRRILVEIQVWL
jgi:hypothetical protein